MSGTLSLEPGGASGAEAAGPCLFVLLECGRPLAGSSRHELCGLAEVSIGRAAERRCAREGAAGARTLALGVPDPRMSQRHARLVPELDRWIAEDAGSKNGMAVNGRRLARAVLADGDLLELGHTLLLFREAAPAAREPDLFAPIAPAGAARGLATFVPALARAFEDLAALAPAAAPVLIHGETGTGKELAARAVHALSGRAGPFVAVNCGALPAALVEGELFGHRRGAFTGATDDREGLVRAAHGGTLFLDELGDLPPAAQAALLRVLQEREVTPIGGTRAIPVDLKLVAATHHDLADRVARGEFRRDLYARIAGYTLRLPPLRERREDLGLLVAAILERIAPEPSGVTLTCEAGRALARHDWPENIRSLESALGVALPLSRGGPIELAHLPEPVRAAAAIAAPAAPVAAVEGAAAAAIEAPAAPATPAGPARPRSLPTGDALEAELTALLRTHAGNISAIARALDVSRAQVHRWLVRFGLDLDAYRAK